MLRSRSLFAASLSTLLLPALLPAQTMFGRISGSVTDSSGSTIAGASVTVTNTDTQAVRNVTTNVQGFYVADNLPIGPYTVAADHPGFKRAQQTANFVVADGRLTVDFKLQVGDNAQTVDVVASEQTLNSVSAEVAQVIDKNEIDNLALNGRSYMELLTLVPGAVITNPDQFSVLTTLSATNQSVNGHRTNSNLDGGANGSLINNLSPDFTQEVKMQTSNFSSQYGRSSGVAFNVVTLNGTNQFHGGAFEYFRNDALDARNYFSPTKTELRFNDFGYDLGGPIKRTSCSSSSAKSRRNSHSRARLSAPPCLPPWNCKATSPAAARPSMSPEPRRPIPATSFLPTPSPPTAKPSLPSINMSPASPPRSPTRP